jgi:hypothetical protein
VFLPLRFEIGQLLGDGLLAGLELARAALHLLLTSRAREAGGAIPPVHDPLIFHASIRAFLMLLARPVQDAPP